jgi:O-antigen/teichoic acid export membrane protein
MGPKLEKIKRWIATSGFWSMSDQAIVSLGNFLLTVMLARFMSKTEYGVYVVTLGALLVGNAIHSALIAYPVSVQGAHVGPSEIGQFASNGILVTYVFALPVITSLGAITWVLSKHSDLYLFVIGAMLCWQTHETVRRCLMSQLRHKATIFGDAVAYLGQIALVLFLVYRHVQMRAQIGFMAIMVASLAGAVVHAAIIGLRPPVFSAAVKLGRESIRLGRWSLFSVLGYWGTVSLLPWALALKSLAEVANYQTMMNVVQVVNPVMFSVSNLVIPSVAHELRKPDGERSARRITFVYMLQGLVLLAPLFLGIIIAPAFIMRMLYGREAGYAENDAVLRLLVFGGLATYTGHILTAYFFGRKDVEIVGRIQIIATATALICAPLLIPEWGVTGAALTFVAMGIVRGGLLISALWRSNKEREQEAFVPRELYIETSPIPPTDGV